MTEADIARSLAQRDAQLENWRGRRLLACQAADHLDMVVAALGRDDGTHPLPEGGLPVVSDAVRDELRNTVANLLRMTLALNDGHVSSQSLQRF